MGCRIMLCRWATASWLAGLAASLPPAALVAWPVLVFLGAFIAGGRLTEWLPWLCANYMAAHGRNSFVHGIGASVTLNVIPLFPFQSIRLEISRVGGKEVREL